MSEDQQALFAAAVAALQQQAAAAAAAQHQQQQLAALNLVQSQPLPANFPNFNLPPVEKIGGPKYRQLLKTIEELGKDLKPIYCNNKLSIERYKRDINHVRSLIRECQAEIEKDRVLQNQKLAADLAKIDKEREVKKEE